MLRLPLISLQSITFKGIVIDIAFPNTENIHSQDMLQFLGALLIYEEDKVTNLYVIDLYKFITVSTSQIGFHQMCWITSFETELIILEDDNYTTEHVMCIGKLLSNCKPTPLGNKTWSSENSQFDYKVYINTLNECYKLYRTLKNELVLNLVTLFNSNYDTNLFTKPLGSTLEEVHNIINLLESNYPGHTLT